LVLCVFFFYAALHLASSNGHIDVVKLLLEKSADPSLRNMQGHKPHFLASKNHHKDIVPLLFDQKGTLRAVKARPIKVSDGII
jgi:ankyrin repeat protein